MKKYFTAAIIFAAFSASVFAGGSVFGGDTFNTTNNTTNNNPVANGGQGGTGIGFGGSAKADANAFASSKADATAIAAQQQGQAQGQVQGQSLHNSNKSSAYNSGNNTSVNVQGDTVTYRAAASSSWAPNIYPTAVCMGSSSIGGSGVTFGFSVGSSWTDKNCMLLEQVRAVSNVLGDKETATLMMCQVDAYRVAREQAGKPCPAVAEPK